MPALHRQLGGEAFAMLERTCKFFPRLSHAWHVQKAGWPKAVCTIVVSCLKRKPHLLTSSVREAADMVVLALANPTAQTGGHRVLVAG